MVLLEKIKPTANGTLLLCTLTAGGATTSRDNPILG